MSRLLNTPVPSSTTPLPILLPLILLLHFPAPAQQPSVESITPPSGPAGSCVTITGRSFLNPSVKFDDRDATLIPSRSTATRLEVTVPPLAPIARATVTVTNANNERATSPSPIYFTVSAPPDLSYEPATAIADTQLVLNSSAGIFDAATESNNVVTIADKRATALKATSTALTLKVPQLPPGRYAVKLTIRDCYTQTGPDLTVNLPKPTITTFNPSTPAPGDTITVTGTNFTQVTAAKIGTCELPVKVLATDKLDVVITETCNGPIILKTATGLSDPTLQSVQVDVSPKITKITPPSGRVGDPVTIYGRNLKQHTSGAPTPKVNFNGLDAPVKYAQETEIGVLVPQGATDGFVFVDNLSKTAQAVSPEKFQVVATQMFTPARAGAIGSSDRRELLAWMPNFHEIENNDSLWAPPGAELIVTSEMNAKGEVAVYFTKVPTDVQNIPRSAQVDKSEAKEGQSKPPAEELASTKPAAEPGKGPAAGSTCKCVKEQTAYLVAATQLQTIYPTTGGGWTFGILAVPFKFYVSNQSLSGAATVGGYFGREFSSVGLGLAVVGAGGVGVVPISKNDGGIVTTTNAPSLSLALGGILNLTKSGGFQAGLVVGFDWAGKTAGFNMEGKPWIAFSLGTSISR